jgi:3-isopropylmalate dehydratase small subunit
VTGRNFGGGSSRTQAPVALKYAEISAVVTESFARIFQGKIDQEDGLKIAITNYTVENNRTTFHARKVPEFMQQMLLEGGIV